MEIAFKTPKILKKAEFFPALQKLAQALSFNNFGKEIYPRLVGGCVRDLLLGKIASDIDICTPIDPYAVIEIATKIGAHALPTGIKHGTVKIILSHHKFEVTTLREDLECDGRHAKVNFTHKFEEDAKRRDFTINALSYCIKTEILYDYFNGINDLKNRSVIFIGNSAKRIHEDALRIMRFFRFTGYYANNINQDGYEACIQNKHLLNILSQERITAEFNKILIAPKVVEILRMMEPILSQIHLEQIDTELLSGFLKSNQNISIELRYAILLHRTQESSIKGLLRKMKLSNAFIKKIYLNHKTLTNIASIEPRYTLLEALYNNKQMLDDYLIILEYYGTLNDNLKEKILYLGSCHEHIPRFPINGSDVVNCGVSGSNIGIIMKKLETLWINSEFKLTKQELMGCLKNI